MASSKLEINSMFKVLIFIMFFSAIIGSIASTMVTLAADTTNFTAAQIVLIGLVTTVVVAGVVYKIATHYFGK